MTTPHTIPFDAARFLQHMHGVSFSSVGVFMLIRSHMLLTPDYCMTREGIHAALRTRSPHAIDLVASVIDDLFEIGRCQGSCRVSWRSSSLSIDLDVVVDRFLGIEVDHVDTSPVSSFEPHRLSRRPVDLSQTDVV